MPRFTSTLGIVFVSYALEDSDNYTIDTDNHGEVTQIFYMLSSINNYKHGSSL